MKLWGGKSQQEQDARYAAVQAATLLAYSGSAVTAARASTVSVVDTEIIAWRAWGIALDAWNQPILHSVTYTTHQWDGPTRSADVLPDAVNAHGIYARATREQLEQEYGGQPVIGEVALSGQVVEAERGYRAERAAIRSLYLVESYRTEHHAPLVLEDLLASRYQVAVQRRREAVVCNGWISMAVAPGLGATQRIYFPQLQGVANAVGGLNSLGGWSP